MLSKRKPRRSEGVLDHLGLSIANGSFEVGHAIPTETELMEAYKVGRSSVREAISTLTALGMVAPVPRRGTIVTEQSAWNMLSRDVLRWLMEGKASMPGILEAIDEARRVFEPAAAALVAKRATRDQIIKIEIAMAAMETAAECGDPEASITADRMFHLAILQATGNPILEAFDTALDSVLGILFGVTANHMDNFRDNLGNHLSVLEAIRRGDEASAREAMLETINFTTNKMKDAKLIS